ncbi:hypothetical protein KC326_g9304 [Hortaea werneckii]|nr:hypothetical protein KC326_g9304 [Hortaea werneckii]
MAQVPERVLSWLYSVLHEYHDPQRTYTSVAQTLSAYPTLSPRTEVFTHETGRSALLLVLSGTLPTHFRGAEYRFPIKIWFPHTYPHEAPMVFVTPGWGMAIRPGQHTHGSVYEPQQRQPQPPPPVEMSATTNSPPPPPKPPKPGQEPVFPERSTSRNLARDGPPLPPLPHERVGSAQYAASPPPSTPMFPNRTGSVSRPPPPPSSQGMSGYEAAAGQHGPPATPLAHQQFQQVRAAAAAAGREGSPVSPMMPNGQGILAGGGLHSSTTRITIITTRFRLNNHMVKAR